MNKINEKFHYYKEQKIFNLEIKLRDHISFIEKNILLKNKGFKHANRLDETDFHIRNTYSRIR
ncbi:MAG: hypothetical protein K4H23_04375 [Mollicutes bacterium PWAP]|nr:hypothetical protein [Mollicutes bacterium PWAP]